jgi:hypothetical protein
MTRLLCAVSVVVTLLGCSDPVSDPVADPGSTPVTGPAPDPSYIWANPPGCDSGAPALRLPQAQRDSLGDLTMTYPSLDRSFYILSLHTPGGFAGIYKTPVNGRNRVVLNFVDTTNLAASLDSLAQFGTAYTFTRDSVLINVVRWDWVKLFEWYRYIFLTVKQWPDGWTSSDIDEVANRLGFGGYPIAGRDSVAQVLSQIPGLPCWLAAVRFELPATIKSGAAP